MKFYHNSIGYKCEWKSLMKGSELWYSMEPARLSITMPKSIYNDIINSLKLRTAIQKSKSLSYGETEPMLNLKILKELNEEVKWGIHSSDQIELWEIDALLDRISISSEFPDGTIIAKLDINIDQSNKCDKSELRELLLNEIL